ncbi:glycosyltransferase family 4 protein [Pseudomonas atacamensis]|uniref:MraY family glycosyltransferase n=1 Tax=Pseudomonas atacamensis TaxID=2565368 RepID=UPI00215F216C|nr:glycosyltransferase family 4 protein [Pseudomonas atacamensis]UVL12723.1 glycosyltransferase family 4 protein [Pseudomonas atacamensis]
MSSVWLVPVVFASAFILTALLRRYALSKSLIDIPNDRSSHTIPTPRGGGVAIVVTFLAALCLLFAGELIPTGLFVSVMGAGAVVAIIGFMDDHGHIAARWRLLGHFVAAAWALYWLGGLPPIHALGLVFDLGWAGASLAAVFLVWMLNLYNFMDGIDGIAGVEGISVCLGACVLYALGARDGPILPALLLASSLAGFLMWNFPFARIFMGDAGSGFLGMILGIFSLQAAWLSSDLLWGILILLGVFIVDATFTLLRRLFHGEKIYEAHRSHAYQVASRRCGKHWPVTMGVGLINLLWLLPIAISVTQCNLDGVIGIVLAYTPLVILASKCQAGRVEAA